MPYDNDGNLTPLMLSDLIRTAQEALAKYGDLPVWVETCVAGAEYNVEHSRPVVHPPDVGSPRSLSNWWPGEFSQAFVVDGA